MTTTDTKTITRSPLAGAGTLVMAIGLVVVFFGQLGVAIWALGLGATLVGVGLFIVLIAATRYFFEKR